MKRVIKLTENDISKIVKRIVVERLGVPDNISETAEQIVGQIYNEFIRNTESYEYGETPDIIQVFGKYKIGDHEFDEVQVSIIPDKRFRSKITPIFVSFALDTTATIENYRYIRDDTGGVLKINIVIATGDSWKVSEVAVALLSEKHKIVSIFSHELHHEYVGSKSPSLSSIKRTEYEAVQSLHFENIRPIYNFLFYLYFSHAIEEIVRPSEVYSAMRTQNITKSQFKEFFQNNQTIQILKKIRDFKVNTMISELYNYIPHIDEFFDEIEEGNNFPFRIPGRGNNDETKIHAFLYVIYKLIIFSKIGSYGDFLNRTIDIIDPFAILFGEKGFTADSIQKMVNDKAKSEELLKKYANKVGKIKNYRDFFGNEEKMLNFVADKTIRKLSKLYDMAKDDTSSSIVNWDLHHKINKTAEKTIQEVKKLFREGKLEITPPTEDDLKFIKDKKPKL
jgi:hypothetical protein